MVQSTSPRAASPKPEFAALRCVSEPCVVTMQRVLAACDLVPGPETAVRVRKVHLAESVSLNVPTAMEI
jgi:hypothetical protein